MYYHNLGSRGNVFYQVHTRDHRFPLRVCLDCFSSCLACTVTGTLVCISELNGFFFTMIVFILLKPDVVIVPESKYYMHGFAQLANSGGLLF